LSTPQSIKNIVNWFIMREKYCWITRKFSSGNKRRWMRTSSLGAPWCLFLQMEQPCETKRLSDSHVPKALSLFRKDDKRFTIDFIRRSKKRNKTCTEKKQHERL
jgi:hypothetical protein